MNDDQKPFHNPFSALKPLRDALGPPSPAPPIVAAAPPLRPTATTIARAVVRYERSGRGGKEVTVVEQLGLTTSERETWLKALKAALGCGGKVEEDRLMLQGDQRKRLPALLTARGVKKITVS